MSLSIVRCKRCGRVFAYYFRHNRVDCQNTSYCKNKIWLDEESTLPIKFGVPEKSSPDTAYILINSFNNNTFLAAKVFSVDGNNFMIIPIDERKTGLLRRDTLDAIPLNCKHQSAWDGHIIQSGLYPVSPQMEEVIRKSIDEGVVCSAKDKGSDAESRNQL